MIPAEPERIYSAWLDAASHSAFTGEEATFEPFVGGRHTAFGGYSEGTNLELLPGRRIVQSWRAKDFPDGSPDSRLEVTLEETLGGTVVTILHSELPSGQSERYRDGWVKFYLEPLKQFFAADSAMSVVPADEEDDGGEVDEPATVEATPPVEAAPAKPKRAAVRPAATAKAAARKPAKRAVAKAARVAKPAKKSTKKTSAARRAAAPKAAKAKGKAKPKAKAKKAAPKKKPAKRRK